MGFRATEPANLVPAPHDSWDAVSSAAFTAWAQAVRAKEGLVERDGSTVLHNQAMGGEVPMTRDYSNSVGY